MKNSYSRHVQAHSKSVSLGGAISLFPVPEALTNGFATQITLAILNAETAAYRQGREDAKVELRKALGLQS